MRSRVCAAAAPVSTPGAFWIDDFARSDGAVGNDWVDGYDYDPLGFEPLAIIGGDIGCAAPETRFGVDDPSYLEPAEEPDPETIGVSKFYAGVGAIWRTEINSTPLTATHYEVGIRWVGHWGGVASGHHVEATPLVNVVPGTVLHGFGAWPSHLLGVGVWFVGYLGYPVEQFHIGAPVIDDGALTHTDGVVRDIRIRTTGTTATVWLDGEQVSFNTYGTDPIPIDPSLHNSPYFGATLDAHLVDPTADIPDFTAIQRVTYRTL